MKKAVAVLILGLCVWPVLSAQAFAEDRCCCRGMKMGMGMGMQGGMDKMDKMDLNEIFFRKVGLIKNNAALLGVSDEQMQKIKMIKSGLKKSMIKSDSEVDLLVIDIEEALGKEEIDMNGVNALIDKKYMVKSQAAKTLIGAYAELKKSLNKEQMKKLSEIWMKDEMKCDMKGGMMEGKR